jgi:hypothetical protein
MRSTFFSLVCFAITTSCIPRESLYDAEFAAEPQVERRAPGVAIAHVDVSDDDAAGGTPTRAAAVPLSERAMRPRPDPVFFHLGAGYGALGHIDVVPCRDRGLPSGYMRLRATFRPSGRVAHAALESVSEPPEEALTCIGEQLEATSVPPFDGADVTLTRIFYVD